MCSGRVGEIQVHTFAGFRGYINDDEKSTAGQYRTNDSGCVNASGSLEIFSRMSDLMEICGTTIPLFVVEEINVILGVKEVAVFSIRDENKRGGVPCAAVVGNDDVT